MPNRQPNRLHPDLSKLRGRTVTQINGGELTAAELLLSLDDKKQLLIYGRHRRAGTDYLCSWIVGICGDFEDLIGVPILEVNEAVRSHIDPPSPLDPILPIGPGPNGKWDHYTIVCQEFRTEKGSVTVKWFGNDKIDEEYYELPYLDTEEDFIKNYFLSRQKVTSSDDIPLSEF